MMEPGFEISTIIHLSEDVAKPSVVVNTCNPSTQDAEAEES
jgi:hypothetical protein